MRSLAVRDPLSPAVYLLRNAGRTLPLIGVLVLAVTLISGIVAIMNSIPLSIRTIYSFSKAHFGVAPRGDLTLVQSIRPIILREAPVKIGRTVVCRASDLQVKGIVGGFPFSVLAMEQDDMAFYVERMGSTGLAGRLPKPGEAALVVSEPVARNLGHKIGDVILGPQVREAYSPNEVKIVGIAQTDVWFALAPIEYHRVNHFPPVDALLVFAADPDRQEQLDRWAVNRFKGERARILTNFLLEEETQKTFATLYTILNVVIGTLVIVITIMMAMLINIYQGQRMQEFALLQALGFTRKRLIRRVLAESGLVVFLGWLFGVALALGLLWTVKTTLMDPKAYAIDLLDMVALAYTLPVPVAIFLAATFTVLGRFRRFDPVGIVERRLV